MKIQRSHFRLITIFLVCAFLATVLMCAARIGLITPPVPAGTGGNQPAAEESSEAEGGSESPDESTELNPESQNREPEGTALPTEEYITTGL